MTQRSSFPTVPLAEVPLERSASRPTVIVVDDESNIANTLTEILFRNGYAAVAAYDAEGALETALLKPPQILITDVMLPGTNGIDLAIRMRRIFPDCKVLLFSGQAGAIDLLSRAGHDGHEFEILTKPVHPLDLLARVSEFVAPCQEGSPAAM
ncbi:MAG: response regulator [Terracidiphilus sp.]